VNIDNYYTVGCFALDYNIAVADYSIAAAMVAPVVDYNTAVAVMAAPVVDYNTAVAVMAAPAVGCNTAVAVVTVPAVEYSTAVAYYHKLLPFRKNHIQLLHLATHFHTLYIS
jgi:hypothetical protein